MKAALQPLFDHLIGNRDDGRVHGQAERFRGLEVDHSLVLVRGLHWKVSRILALENAIDVGSRLSVLLDLVPAKGDQAALVSEKTFEVDGGEPVPGCKRDDEIAM